jgi:hypothetical protein
VVDAIRREGFVHRRAVGREAALPARLVIRAQRVRQLLDLRGGDDRDRVRPNDASRRRPLVTRECGDEQRLTRTVGANDRPLLVSTDLPGRVGEDGTAVDLEGRAFERDARFACLPMTERGSASASPDIRARSAGPACHRGR